MAFNLARIPTAARTSLDLSASRLRTPSAQPSLSKANLEFATGGGVRPAALNRRSFDLSVLEVSGENVPRRIRNSFDLPCLCPPGAASARMPTVADTPAPAPADEGAAFMCVLAPKELVIGEDGLPRASAPHAQILEHTAPIHAEALVSVGCAVVAARLSSASVLSLSEVGGAACAFAGTLNADNVAYLHKRLAAFPQPPAPDCPHAELVALCYRRFGEAATLTKLRGQYSFVLADEQLGRVFAARSTDSPLALFHRRAADGTVIVSSAPAHRLLASASAAAAQATEILEGQYLSGHGRSGTAVQFARSRAELAANAASSAAAVLRALAPAAPRTPPPRRRYGAAIAAALK